ncbi:hypothetical protein FSP39_000406 [Pinctada imbricata]|uniref:Neprilysin n=1 Tax=Pinctada imbricata TaxID=66713 RepID=A0AA88YS09_PINIB|nr:hypothetical protein FSP39_000406 [Pinctada imbricata]
MIRKRTTQQDRTKDAGTVSWTSDVNYQVADPSETFNKNSRTVLEKALIFLVLICACAIIALVVTVAILSTKEDEKTSPPHPPYSLDPPLINTFFPASRLTQSLNQNVDPCEDFFEFACGTWMRKNVIPEDRSSLDMFGVLRDDVEVIEKIILEEVMSDEPAAVTKAKDLYKSCINASLIEDLGTTVVTPLLEELGGWPLLGNWTEADHTLTSLLVKLAKYNNKPIIDLYVYTDLKNSTVRILYIDQSSFGMPGRKYYLQGRDDVMVKAYEVLAKEIATELGADPTTVQNDVKEMVDLEFEIANISMADEDRRDSNALYNPMTIRQISQNFTPPAATRFDWLPYFQTIMNSSEVGVAITEEETVIVRAVPYFEKLFQVLEKYSHRTIANYLVWRMMQNRANNLPERFQDLLTKYNKVIYGTSTPRARWRRCASYVNSNMGLAVGRLFVREAFDEAAKADTLEMIGNLRGAFEELLESNTWMDEETRTLAREKAKFIQEKIGYEDYILDDKELNRLYENYTTNSVTYFDNVLHILNRANVDSLRRLREEVDKNEWYTAPATVNAYYNSVLNRIMFPAGILQPPFYSKSQPKSMNYGGIGVVIGHEITHGFDDRGRQYDKDGNLKQWWTSEVIDKFKGQAECIINQYGNFSVPEADGMKLNGINTQGENIADNGGLKQSYRAYRNWVKSRGAEEQPLPGVKYNHNQIFFINFAQIWCSNMRKENAINRILTGVHSPGRFRVIGTLQNSAEFTEAFNCPAMSYMSPKQRCSVW